jgi:hypothetical protein
MNKYVLILVLIFFFTLQSYKKEPVNASNAIELKAASLSEKLNINGEAVRLAITGYEKLKQLGRLANIRYLTIADFSMPSSVERFYIIDMEQQVLWLQTLVAHGRNSGKLFANSFSNKNASNQSSLGFYITGNPYTGKHGNTLELNGIEAGINDHAKDRAIVLHGASYVSKEFIKAQGYIGRSLGCPAVPDFQVNDIIKAIKGASCLFVYAPNKQYIKQSSLLN